MRILLVEDEGHLAAGLKLNLQLEGYAVDVATTAREASESLMRGPVDTVILDVMLPDMTGFELCRGMRAAGDVSPVLMLSAKHTPEDRIEGLNAGADDYLTKPFALQELLARVRSLLRRQRWQQSEGSLACAGIRLDPATRTATVLDAPLKLTQLEFDLLAYFLRHRGRVIARDELLREVWRLQHEPHTRTVDNFIMRLRRYLEPAGGFLQSVRGVGYIFREES
jgi:DNA-binding response OmpR family regulator